MPGLGTLLAALTLLCGGRSSFDTNLEVRTTGNTLHVHAHFLLLWVQGLLVGIGTAFLQAATAVIVVGWFWSIMWERLQYWQLAVFILLLRHGIFFVRKASEARVKRESEKNTKTEC